MTTDRAYRAMGAFASLLFIFGFVILVVLMFVSLVENYAAADAENQYGYDACHKYDGSLIADVPAACLRYFQ